MERQIRGQRPPGSWALCTLVRLSCLGFTHVLKDQLVNPKAQGQQDYSDLDPQRQGWLLEDKETHFPGNDTTVIRTAAVCCVFPTRSGSLIL